jgi:hypothetical protein
MKKLVKPVVDCIAVIENICYNLQNEQSEYLGINKRKAGEN